MTTFDVVAQILEEMNIRWRYHHSSSYSAIIIPHNPETEVVIFDGCPTKLMLFDKIETLSIYSKEVDLHHPNSIQEIKDLLLGWFKKSSLVKQNHARPLTENSPCKSEGRSQM